MWPYKILLHNIRNNMSLYVYERCIDGSLMSGTKVKWPIDDYVFHMVLRKGRMINKHTEPCIVEAIDFSQTSDGKTLIFHMTPLEASSIATAHPEFETTGLCARWKLSASTGLVKLVTVMTYKSHEDAIQFLLDSASNDLVRQRYATILGDMEIIKK